MIFVGCGRDGVHFCQSWPSRKLPWPRGFTINAQFRPCMNFWTLFFPFPSIIRLWLGGFFNFFLKKFPLRCCFVLFPSVNSELSVSAGVGVVLWLLFCLFLVSLIFISRCLNMLGLAGIVSFVPVLHHFAY